MGDTARDSFMQQPMYQQTQTHQPIQTTGQPMEQRFQDVATPQQLDASDAIAHAVQVCEWCAFQCVQLGDREMAECIQLCEDVSELGETALSLIPRQSRFTQQHLQTLQGALQACAQECSRHHHAHCQECAQVLPDAVQTIQQFNDTFQ